MEVVAKPWGWFKVLVGGSGYQVKEIIVRPGQRLSLQYHNHRSEVWTCVSGEGIAEIGKSRFSLWPGRVVEIEKEQHHRLINDSETQLHIIEVWLGDDLREDDIVRIEDDYNR